MPVTNSTPFDFYIEGILNNVLDKEEEISQTVIWQNINCIKFLNDNVVLYNKCFENKSDENGENNSYDKWRESTSSDI